MELLTELWKRAKRNKKRIVIPEASDPRVLKAADILLHSKLVDVTLIGNPDKIRTLARQHQCDINKADIEDPPTAGKLSTFAEFIYMKRKDKGLTLEEAKKLVLEHPLFYGGMLVQKGEADGMVGGSLHPTTDTIRATLWTVGMTPDSKILSSFFIMLLPKKEFGENGVLFYADCGVVPDPNPEELAQIAIDTAASFRKLMNKEPKIGMLSFSTKGSAKHPAVDRVIEATRIVREKKPDLFVEGELQLDAAIVLKVAQQKAPGSQVAGYANILIFPDLNSGNIAYKITERLAGATALGPLFQGPAKPINDLSRGCSVEDIVSISVITALQAS